MLLILNFLQLSQFGALLQLSQFGAPSAQPVWNAVRHGKAF
jgi:hypothetical protein